MGRKFRIFANLQIVMIMWKNVEHIGIAVKDLESVNEIYSKLFQRDPYKKESVDLEQVDTSFFKL